MKYIIIICVAAFTLFLGGRSLSHSKAESIVCALAEQESMGSDVKVVHGHKVESKDATYGPVMLPEVNVIMKKKVTKVIWNN